MSDRSELVVTGEPFSFDTERDAEFERLVQRYPIRESMIMPALWLAQEQAGWISAEAIDYIAERIGTYSAKVFELATFYTMYHLKPVGSHHICVCRTLSCWLRGHGQRGGSRRSVAPGVDGADAVVERVGGIDRVDRDPPGEGRRPDVGERSVRRRCPLDDVDGGRVVG